MKVLFLTSDSSAVAGVGPCLADALEHIDHSRIEPFVVCPWEAPGAATIAPRLQALGIPVINRSLSHWLTAPDNRSLSHFLKTVRALKARAWSLASLIERENIELVYTNGLPCLDGALAARLTRRPHIWHLHEAIRNNPDLQAYCPAWMVESVIGKLSTLVIVNSHFLARELTRTAEHTPLRVIHNGVALEAALSASRDDAGIDVRSELGLAPNTLIGVAVGTVAPRKGYSTVLDATAQVLKQSPDLVLLIAGAQLPEHAASLRAHAAKLGIASRVRFLGPRQDVSRLLAAADIFVHGATQETFGRVIIEAMAAGKPVVATRSGGPEEIVLEGETGFLVPVNAATAMAERMSALLTSPALRARMGKSGRTRAVESFSIERYADTVQRTILDTSERHRTISKASRYHN